MSKKWKQGIASFYIVAFSTLVMVVVAASFSTVIISEVTRSSNDDLSQSAYDSALAGIEDAKLAYSNYQRCLALDEKEIGQKPTANGQVSCRDIMYWINNPDCDMVGHILGRIDKTESGEVDVKEETANGTVTNQAYTCVKIQTRLSNYAASLTSSNPVKVVRLQFNDSSISASAVTAIKFSWYTNRGGNQLNSYLIKYDSLNGSKVEFKPGNQILATPPMVELRMVQTSDNFSLSEVYGQSKEGKTDRATLYLVPIVDKADSNGIGANVFFPSDEAKEFAKNSGSSYIGTYNDGGGNNITKGQVAGTNDLSKNLPFVVYCNDAEDSYACNVKIELPEPIGGDRINDTFMFMVSLPYGEPNTDFAIEVCVGDGGDEKCSSELAELDDGTKATDIYNAQVSIDSTGRANDVYRRIETRLETMDSAFPYPYYAIEALGDDNDAISKAGMTVRCEWNMYDGDTGGNFMNAIKDETCPSFPSSN